MARRRRWILRIILGLVGLLVVVVALALLTLAHLDAGPVKGYIRSKARAQGIELDYDQASVTLGSITLRGVRVRSPAGDADLARYLVTVGSVDAHWSPFHLLVDDMVVRDVAVNVVVAPDGSTSIDRLVAGMPPSPPSPPEPLSTLGARVVPSLTAKARVEGLTVNVLRRGAAPVHLVGLAAAAELGDGKLALHLPPGEIKLDVGERSATALLAGDVSIDGHGAGVELGLGLLQQDLDPRLPPVKKLVDLGLKVDFVPGEKRTHVALQRLALLDGAVTADADADLFDGTPLRPVVHRAACRIDAAALAKWAPKDLGPIELEAEPISCGVADLELLPTPRGRLIVGAKIHRLVYRYISAGDAELSLDASAAGGWPVKLKLVVAAGHVAAAGQRVTRATVGIEGTAKSFRELDAKLTAAVARVDGTATVEDLHLGGDVEKLADDPLDAWVRVKLDGRAGSVVHPSARLTGVDFGVEGQVNERTSSSGTVRVDAARLETPSLPPGPVHLVVHATTVEVDRADPAHSRARAEVEAAFGGGHATGTLAGRIDDLTWDLKLDAEQIGPARTIAVATKGHYGGEIEQESTIEVGRVATASATLRAAHLHVVSSGTTRRQQAKITAALDGVTVRGAAVGSPKLDLDGSVDLDGPKVEVTLAGTHPEVKLHLTGSVDRNRALRFDLDGHAAGLGPLAALLPPGPDWSQLGVDVKASGNLTGILRNGALAPDAAAAARGQATVEVRARGVHVRSANEGSTDFDGATVKVVAELGANRRVVADVDMPALSAVASGVHVAVEQLQVHVDATQERGAAGRAHLTLRIGKLGQSAFPSYAVRDADLDVDLDGDPASVMNLRASLKNAGAGTQFDVAGQIDQRVNPGGDAVPGRHSLTLEGTIVQSLDALTGAPDRLRARGQVSVPFRVESGDLSLFTTTATVKLAGVTVELPQQQVTISDMSGELPIAEEIVYGPAGAEMVGHGERGLYPQLRFADHQPFLATADYLSIREVRVGKRSFGPIAGNVRLDRDVLALDQLELSALGGKIAGQCLVALGGNDTQIAFRGKVTGIKPTEGDELLDANAAITLTPYRLGLEGRVEFVRIGKQHLYDLLDLYDPYHAEVAANRVRLGLKLGYPKQVRLAFLRGFASLGVELGGIAGLVRIDEIQGIPIGPALSRWLAPVLEAKR